MKLYNLNLSPFASRCRIQIYAKGIQAELVPPPGGPSSEEYKRITPFGRVPALEVDGQVIPESEVICEYLEDRFPTPSLRPEDALDRARARLLSRAADTYVVPPLVVLFGQANSEERDSAVIEERTAEVEKGLDLLEGLIGKGGYAVGQKLSLADCTLVPIFFFVPRLFPALGRKNPLESRTNLREWWTAVQQDPNVARVVGEMDAALREMLSGGSPS